MVVFFTLPDLLLYFNLINVWKYILLELFLMYAYVEIQNLVKNQSTFLQILNREVPVNDTYHIWWHLGRVILRVTGRMHWDVRQNSNPTQPDHLMISKNTCLLQTCKTIISNTHFNCRETSEQWWWHLS